MNIYTIPGGPITVKEVLLLTLYVKIFPFLQFYNVIFMDQLLTLNLDKLLSIKELTQRSFCPPILANHPMFPHLFQFIQEFFGITDASFKLTNKWQEITQQPLNPWDLKGSIITSTYDAINRNRLDILDRVIYTTSKRGLNNIRDDDTNIILGLVTALTPK